MADTILIRKTNLFASWLNGLRDERARARINLRLDRLAEGNAGQSRSVGGMVSELKIDYGPGYRVYFTRRGLELVILLCGGVKGSQRRDIDLAQRMAKDLEGDDA